jgi:hypothetical protein
MSAAFPNPDRHGGVVKAPIDLIPMGAVFAAVWKGESAEQSVTIVNNLPTPLQVRGLETEGQHFTAKLVTQKPDKVYKVIVAVPHDVPPGRYTGFVYVDTDSARFSRIRLGVNIFVKTEMYLSFVEPHPIALPHFTRWSSRRPSWTPISSVHACFFERECATRLSVRDCCPRWLFPPTRAPQPPQSRLRPPINGSSPRP